MHGTCAPEDPRKQACNGRWKLVRTWNVGFTFGVACCIHRVLERVTAETSSGAGNRNKAVFEEDSAIDVRFRNQLSDFQMSGYDRGHMVSLLNQGRSRFFQEVLMKHICPWSLCHHPHRFHFKHCVNLLPGL